MQAPSPMQRQMQRRSPGADNGQGIPSNIPGRAMSPAMGGAMGGPPLSRPATTSSNRPVGGGAPGARRANTSSGSGSGAASSSGANVPLSQIEKSVTHLLVATKQLLETLTQWSRGQATDTQVSDVYVRLGYEFNMACRAFTAINVDTSDLGNVPELLRNILESTLSQEASSESLEKYLPRIRDIIINLLHGLKRKQQKLRQKQARDRESSTTSSSTDSIAGRANSLSTSGSAGSGLTNLLNESIEGGYGDLQSSQQQQQQQQQPQQHQPPPHLPPNREDSKDSSPGRRYIPPRDQSRGAPMTYQSNQSSVSSLNIPTPPPYPESQNVMPTSSSVGELNIDAFPPPPPPKSQQSAFMALQRNGDHLERRASRRYSQYHIQKHLGGNSFSSGVPLLPPQTTPVPNRGRGEVRESMRAVQVRNAHSNSSLAGNENSPMRVPARVPEERDMGADGKEVVSGISTDVSRRDDSPMARTPDDKYPQPSATLSGPPADMMPAVHMLPVAERSPSRRRAGSNEGRTEAEIEERTKSIKAAQAALVGETHLKSAETSTPPPLPPPLPAALDEPASKELTLFLQYKSKVKKFVLPEGYNELTIGRLQLAFIEKFSWNTQQNGSDLPEIYIQDPVSGVRHELEDLADIKDRTVLALNVEQLDEVKRHIDEGIGSLKSMVQQVQQNVDEQGAALQRVSDRQQEATKEMSRMASLPPIQPMTPPADSPRSASMGGAPSSGSILARGGKRISSQQLAEVQSLRRDLAVLRQTYSNFQSDVESSMTALRNKAVHVKQAVAETAIPDVDSGKGQAIVASGRKQLSAESDRLVNKVDDLQDLVEDLRKDVVHRGVRPLPRQLELVTKDITQLSKDLKKMEDTMKRDKPIWTKIWEKELEEVCKGRDELQLAEDLLVDLQDDLEKASETFALVEQATKEQMKDAGANGAAAVNGTGVAALGGAGTNGIAGGQSLISRQLSRGLKSLGDGANLDPNTAKEGVLGEVRALQPNHENRLEAIERAEKLRQKELESRRVNPLMRELSDFVEEGKLKKSGGFEEVERSRKAKDDRIRREVWERQNGVVLDVPPETEGEGDGGLEEGAEGAEGEGVEGDEAAAVEAGEGAEGGATGEDSAVPL